jgi:acetyltransferase-like isoleucine patch superfamily enzyme
MDDPLLKYREQHKQRLSWMPWLYPVLKERHRGWAVPWQREVQQHFMEMETIVMGSDCFVAPSAHLFAELGRPITLHDRVAIAAEVFMHGPITLANDVSVNARATLDGGGVGITVGEGSRIATGATLFAFNHAMDPDRPIREQPVTSVGIVVGVDVWIGANAGITDGVTVGDHAVVAMGAMVTRDVPPYAVVAGSPARVVGDRRRPRPQGARESSGYMPVAKDQTISSHDEE